MGSKGRPPPFIRRPPPGPGLNHPDPFGPGIRPPPGAFPTYDMLPPPEVMEQKLAGQHVEMQKLATENQRLAATHGILRQELVAAQNELHMLHSHIGAVKSENEHQMKGLIDRITKMEAELQSAEPIKMELQKARTDAQNLITSRQELISNAQKLTQDLQRARMDVQKIPTLISELEGLRQEYQHCRATYEYEKKLYNDHLESLQVMEKNYVAMAREVEKLQAELANTSNINRMGGGSYGGTVGYGEKDATGHYPVGQHVYDDGFSVSQGRGPLPGGVSGGGGGGAPSHDGALSGAVPAKGDNDAQRGPGYDAKRIGGGHGYDAQGGPGASGYEPQRGPGAPNYDTPRGPNGPGYEAQKGPGYDIQRGPIYDAQRAGAGYDMQRGPGLSGYDPQRGAVYDNHRGAGYDTARGAAYDAQRGANYDAASRGAAGSGSQVQAAPPNNAPYGSATPPARGVGSGYDAPPRGGNAVRR